MNDQPTRYAVLRAGRTWDGLTDSHLQATQEGVLTLTRVPGPANGQAIVIAGPYDVAASGLAVGDCNDLYIADTAGHRLVWLDGVCGMRMVLPGATSSASAAPGHFNTPCGLLITPQGGLAVADSGNGRVQFFRLPTLELHAIWEGSLQTPTGLATDSQERIYVLDRGLKRVLRFSVWGAPDDVYNTAMAEPPGLTSPAFLAVAADDTLYVSDDAANTILRFDPEGQPLGPLPPAESSPFLPRALVASGDRLYVADAADGSILVFDRTAGHYLGVVSGYQGPVTAMAVSQAGELFIKPGFDETVYTLAADAAFVAAGGLTAGPLDAGELSDWQRVVAKSDAPVGTSLKLLLFVTGDALAIPTAADWLEARALDTWLPSLVPAGNGLPGERRYLWLRLLLTTENPGVSPQLKQVQAETAGENYMDYLPALYGKEDAGDAFLQRWLALFRSQLGDLEWTLQAMSQRFDPATAPEDHLAWLATWLAFELPAGWPVEEWRALLLRVYQLYQRRGTLFGLSEFVQLYTGVRPQIIEAFHERRLWLLDQNSLLGFDTGLAPLDAQGMVVPDPLPPILSADTAAPVELAAWSEPEGLIVGEVVVGQSVPLAAANLGQPLFSETAHLFTVLVPAAQVPELEQRQAVRDIIEAEKPAHTDYHLCFVEARMRVGFQARIGIDTIIAGPPEPMALDETSLGLDSALGESEGEAGISRIGQRTRLGYDMIIK